MCLFILNFNIKFESLAFNQLAALKASLAGEQRAESLLKFTKSFFLLG